MCSFSCENVTNQHGISLSGTYVLQLRGPLRGGKADLFLILFACSCASIRGLQAALSSFLMEN